MSKPHGPAHPHPHQHRHKRTAAPGEWASRNRSYVVTLGLIFAALSLVFWNLEGADTTATAFTSRWPGWKWLLLCPSAGLGLVFLLTGLFASQGIVKKVAAATSLSWVTFPIRLLALPVQLVLSVFDRK
jgi:hypothetical protein